MGRLVESLRWTFQNDLAAPFPEVVIFLLTYLTLSFHTVDAGAALLRPTRLTLDMIYAIVFLSGIGGVRAFSMAIEKGELTRQLVTSGMSRSGFLFRKFLSLYACTFGLLLIADLAAFLAYMTYYFSPSAFSAVGVMSPVAWGLAVAEQLALLLFLNSLMLFLTLTLRSPTVSLFLFMTVTLLGVSLYQVGLPPWAVNLQLGYGDYNMVNVLASYAFFSVYFPGSAATLDRVPDLAFYIGLAYRLFGGLVLLLASALRFNSMDLD